MIRLILRIDAVVNGDFSERQFTGLKRTTLFSLLLRRILLALLILTCIHSINCLFKILVGVILVNSLGRKTLRNWCEASQESQWVVICHPAISSRNITDQTILASLEKNTHTSCAGKNHSKAGFSLFFHGNIDPFTCSY